MLRNEGEQLAESVADSFAALETLHKELSQWEAELSREQESLDERPPGDDAALTLARREVKQLEQKNAEQMRALKDLEGNRAAAKAAVEALRQTNAEFDRILNAQDRQAGAHSQPWMTELQAVRETLKRQCDSLETAGPSSARAASDFGGSSAPRSRAAELRRRAKLRRSSVLKR